MDGSVTIYQQNLRALVIEMYKVSNKLTPPFMSELFIEKNVSYNTSSNVHEVISEIFMRNEFSLPKFRGKGIFGTN